MGYTNGIEPSSAGPQPAALPLSYVHHEDEEQTGDQLPLADRANALVEIECFERRLAPLLARTRGAGTGHEAEAAGQAQHRAALARLCRADGDHPDRGIALAHGDCSSVM